MPLGFVLLAIGNACHSASHEPTLHHARSQASDLVQQKIDEKLPWVAEKMAARRRVSAGTSNALTDNYTNGVH